MKDKNNNFNLIRILAALQVLITHAVERLQINNELIVWFCERVLIFFPGVPIFFVISGFLIYSSFERNRDDLLQYVVNRALRIFPALWICVLFAFGLMSWDYEGVLLLEEPKSIVTWLLAQCSVVQFYTPDILRFWGVGVPNGSLWSISVELQFYFILPFLYWILNSWGNRRLIWILLIVFSLGVNTSIGVLDGVVEWSIIQHGKVFVLTHLHYFLMGILMQKYWEKVQFLFHNTYLYWLFGYGLFVIGVSDYLQLDIISYYISTPANLLGDILIGGLTLSFAFSFKGLSQKILGNQDISYGVYIYHMLVINFLVHRGFVEDPVYLWIVVLASLVLASLSWIFIEKKILAKKYIIAKNIRSRLTFDSGN